MTINRWSPDTCGCVIDYQWDPALPAELRAHTVYDIVKACADHSALPSNRANHYAAVLGENVRKNKVLGKLLQDDDLSEEVMTDNGDVYRKLKNGVKFGWSFSGSGVDRVLKVKLTGSPVQAKHKSDAKNWADAEFGSGKVEVE